jgi:glyoxylase-like metal-dependent hydrolase (beta-lactamase superfamily II)
MNIASFTFNDFSENTYVLSDDTKKCCIIDPGCNSTSEQTQLSDYIESNNLTPVKLVNTHCHIDHVLGNKYVADKYNLKLTSHKGEQIVLDNMENVARMYGISYTTSPNISDFLDEGDLLQFGNTTLEVFFTPGHSPASISFFHKDSKQLIAGDVLFQGSIGRTDLPGGDHATLIQSIKEKLLPLGDDVVVYSGHGPSTTIGAEKRHNPFLQ